VENVKPYYKPLIPARNMGRHAYWANFEWLDFKAPPIKDFINLGNAKETQKLKNWLGIHYDGNIYYDGNHCPAQILRNCVHPSIGGHIFNAWLGIESDPLVQCDLFG